MSRQIDDIVYFKKQIADIESDIFFPSLRHHASFCEYEAIKSSVIAQLESGDYDYTDIQKDVEYMESFVDHYYKNVKTDK